MSTPFIVLGLAALLGNAGATWVLFRGRDLSSTQRYAQLGVVWLLPFIGDGIVLVIRGEQASRSRSHDRGSNAEYGGGYDSLPGSGHHHAGDAGSAD